MWGILIAAWMRPLAVALSTASRWFSFDSRYAPGTGSKTYGPRACQIEKDVRCDKQHNQVQQ